MYSFFRLLSLVGLLILITGVILKMGHWLDGSLLLTVGICAACLSFMGRLYLDRRKKVPE